MSGSKRSASAKEVEADYGRFAVGVMSGTSIDGLDAALVRLEGEGLGLRASLVQHVSGSLGDLASRLRAIAEQHPVTAAEIATVAWEFALLHVQLIERLLDQSLPHPLTPSIICVHGQTVYHKPPISFQLINPAPIASRWPEAIVVGDLRQRDLAQGGQGAPITPLADWVMFRDESRSRAIVNLGGFCNVTILPQRAAASLHHPAFPLAGFDVCPCNHILDAVARQTMNVAYDEGGQRAGIGSIDAEAEAELRDALIKQRRMNRSLGTGDESLAWIARHRDGLSPDDLAATACAAIGRAIAAAIDECEIDQIVLAGGGALNEALVAAIPRSVSCEVIRSDDLGVPIQAREAMAMAILGGLHADGIPITLPKITGRRP